MLQILLSFIKNETDDRCWDQRKTNSDYENNKNAISCLCSLSQLESDWMCLSNDLKIKVGVSSCCFEDWFIHKLRKECSNILWGCIDEVRYFILMSCFICFEYKVWAVSEWWVWLVESWHENIIIKFVEVFSQVCWSVTIHDYIKGVLVVW